MHKSAAGDHGSRIGDLDCSEPNNTHQSQSSITERGVIGAGWQRALCNLADLIIDSAGSWATIHRKYGGPNPSALRSQAVTVQPRGRVGGLLHGESVRLMRYNTLRQRDQAQGWLAENTI